MQHPRLHEVCQKCKWPIYTATFPASHFHCMWNSRHRHYIVYYGLYWTIPVESIGYYLSLVGLRSWWEMRRLLCRPGVVYCTSRHQHHRKLHLGRQRFDRPISSMGKHQKRMYDCSCDWRLGAGTMENPFKCRNLLIFYEWLLGVPRSNLWNPCGRLLACQETKLRHSCPL